MKKKGYPSDLSDDEWQIIESLIPPAKTGGRPRAVDIRQIVNAMVYLLRTGCAWRMLPHDYPVWQTVYEYFSQWRQDGTWRRINDALRRDVRVAAGREPEPSAGVLDSQSVKTTEKGGSAVTTPASKTGKYTVCKVNGRKRHLWVDTLGLGLIVVVHAARIQDRDGAKLVLTKIAHCLPRLQLIWADGGYAGQLIEWVKATCHWLLEIVKRSDDVKGFKVLPHRWVVERTFAWLSRYRRLSKAYESCTETSEAMIYAAMIHLRVRRLARARRRTVPSTASAN